MVRRRARLALLVALALALAATAVVVVQVRDGTPPRTARAKDGRIVIRIDDFRLTPQVVRARAGVLTIELRNDGRLGHAFHVRRNGRLWLEEKRLAPGERRVVSRRLERGDYRAFDPLANFEELGLYGTLSVR
jgi:hypothetical protein